MDQVVVMSPMDLEVGEDSKNLFSRLLEQLTQIKMNKAPASQWRSTIEALTQKGVKKAELEVSGVLDYLMAKGQEVLTKQELTDSIGRQLPRIKRIDLESPQYAHYTSFHGLSRKYKERLYVLASEGMLADDEINQLMFEIDDLGFDPAPLLEDPKLVDKLQARLELLKLHRPKMFDFKNHHFSAKVKMHGKNLMAHSRFSLHEDLFFVEEVQSDWAQKGRANNWGDNYPQAPFVTDTEQWAGLVIRDLLQTAARDPSVNRFAWLQANMRNGWSERSSSDDLSVFYDRIVRKIVEKALGKAGSVKVVQVNTKNGPKDVFGFDMTPEVRDALRRAQPMYSRDALLREPSSPDEFVMKALVLQCKTMLGSAHTIRFVSRLFDVAGRREVAGNHLGRLIEISKRAANPLRVGRHEAWHLAHENFLFAHEKALIQDCFGPRNAYDMRARTIAAMRAAGMPNEAIHQCLDYKECAAHAFSLWCEGRLEETPPQVQTLWQRVLDALMKTSEWLNETIYGKRIERVEDLFEALRSGELAARDELMASTEAPSM